MTKHMVSKDGDELASQRAHSFRPLGSIRILTTDGPTDLTSSEISVENVGYKAYGLSAVPEKWVPKFLLVSSSCTGILASSQLGPWIERELADIGITLGSKVIVRSSGTLETLENRGLLESSRCSTSEILTTITRLASSLTVPSPKVHWIIQEYVEPKEKGHLSNERRLKYEKRDWVAEFEPKHNRPGYTTSIGVRRWRDGTNLCEPDLTCNSEPEISLRLRHVAMWATSLPWRIHFEWVWDGRSIRIVQADRADPPEGVDPLSLLPKTIPIITLSSLGAFRAANNSDFEKYRKLKSAKLYVELGYKMPLFYVLDNPEVVKIILSGDIPRCLASDLVELTRRPLIVRTDGLNIPCEKEQMLPRSDELRSLEQAKNWLLTDFTTTIEQNALEACDLCLIAHHFIPSVASAWARGEPGGRIVRVESLWGIPEGLYWYSHDTFEVDTRDVVAFRRLAHAAKYQARSHLRYKGSFIAPDTNGRWIPQHPVAPFDWKKSISKTSWLFEIAESTRLIAEHDAQAVSVMWFVDNHPTATEHKVLPWLHEKSEFTNRPKAAPRRKRENQSEFIIRTIEDWHSLQSQLKTGTRIERIVVDPTDVALIRNRLFAEKLGAVAVASGSVVELSGGILSHVYYTLQRSGAQVECVDLYGAVEDIVEFNKVVRDKIPAIIESRGERVETVRLTGNALVAALRRKLVEEAFEALDAKSGGDLVSELADLQEVIKALCQALQVSPTQVEAERKEKQRIRGAFNKGLMLTKTGVPHSIQQQSSVSDVPPLALTAEPALEEPILHAQNLPTKSVYRRPDLRHIEYQLEKLFTFATEVNRIGDVKESLNFSIPIDNGLEQNFTLTVELRRSGSAIRGVVRLRRNASQLTIDFEPQHTQLEIEFPE